MGDFNADFLTTSKDETFLRDLTSELALKVVEHGPTNFTTVPGKWIDAIFDNADDTITETENRPAPFYNTHNLISVTLDRSTPTLSCSSFSYRPYNKINSDELNLFFQGCDWSLIDSDSPDLTHMLTKLPDNLTLAIDSLAPLTTVIPKKRQSPWIDNELTVLYRKRDAALRRYKGTGDRCLLEEFFLLRKQATETT